MRLLVGAGSWIHTNLSGPGAAGFLSAWSWVFGRDGRRPLAFLWVAVYVGGLMVAQLVGASLFSLVISAVFAVALLGMTVAWAMDADESTDWGGEAALSRWTSFVLELLGWAPILVALDLWDLSVPLLALDIVRALWLSTMLSEKGASGKPVWQRLHRHTLAPVGT